MNRLNRNGAVRCPLRKRTSARGMILIESALALSALIPLILVSVSWFDANIRLNASQQIIEKEVRKLATTPDLENPALWSKLADPSPIRDKLNGLGVGQQVNVSVASGADTLGEGDLRLQDKLTKYPIVVTASFRICLFGSSLCPTFTRKASAFFELSKQSERPDPVDCLGVPVDDPAYGKSVCSCGPNEVWRSWPGGTGSTTATLGGACECVSGYYREQGGSPCVPCTTVSTSTTEGQCFTCPANRIRVGTNCEECPTGTYSLFGVSCFTCDSPGDATSAGVYVKDGVCQICDPSGGQKVNEARSGCICLDGWQEVKRASSGTGAGSGVSTALECIRCPTGQAGTRGTCSPCSFGTKPNTSQTACVACGDQEIATTDPANLCKICPSGYFPTDGHEDGIKESCGQCPAGYRLNENRLGCTQCNLGQKSSSDRTACQPCAPGEYASGPGVCVACSAGQVAIDGNNDGIKEGCGSCSLGQKSKLDGSGCELCAASQFASGQGACSTCQSGKVPTASGTYGTIKDTCTACPFGQKANSSGTCSSCGSNEYASGEGACLTCPSGKVPTASGTYGTIKDTCTACPFGQKAKSSGTCSSCGSNEYSSGEGACSMCPSGKVPTASGTNGTIKDTCTACPLGQKANSSGACISCASNEYASVAGACATCSAGAIPTASGNNGGIRDLCSSCTGGQIVASGGVSCRCPDGSAFNSTSCEPCPAGSAGVGGTCSACPSGKQPNSDRTACVCSGVDKYSDKGFSLDGNTCKYTSCIVPPGKSGGHYTVNGITYCLWGPQCVSVAQKNECAGRKITIEISGTDSVCGCDE